MKCIATRRDGEQCRADARPSRDLCFAHDPDLQARAEQARRTGGENRSNAARAVKHIPRDMKALSKRILEAFEQVSAGELAPDRAHAMARLASVYVQLHTVAEVETRLEALEARAEAGQQRRA